MIEERLFEALKEELEPAMLALEVTTRSDLFPAVAKCLKRYVESLEAEGFSREEAVLLARNLDTGSLAKPG